MKKQLLSLVALVLTASAFAQVENDDMYFNSKDRAALRAQKVSEESSYTTMASAKKSKKAEQAMAAEEVVNPTDSYSARNVNPEFAARSNSQTAASDNQDYFVSNYQYNKSSEINNWNNNFNGWYNNAWYSSNYYQPSIYGWNSPYYGSAYDLYGNPWCNPYYQSGWSSSFSYYWGSSWNYGWGSGIGLSYTYGRPYGYGSPWGYSGFGYGYPMYGGYGYGYYPGNIIIVNNSNYYGENGRKVVYGKRASHGGMVASPHDSYVAPTRSNYPTTVRPTASGGRVAGSSGRQEDYYNRSWRNSQQTQSYPSRSSSNNSWDNSSWNRNNSNSSWSNHGSSRDSNSYSPSNSGGGGGTRQSAPSGSGTSGRSRGRD